MAFITSSFILAFNRSIVNLHKNLKPCYHSTLKNDIIKLPFIIVACFDSSVTHYLSVNLNMYIQVFGHPPLKMMIIYKASIIFVRGTD